MGLPQRTLEKTNLSPFSLRYTSADTVDSLDLTK